MGNGLIIIVVIIGIVVVMGLVRDGTEELKSEPLQSAIESGKTIVNTGKDIINKFRDGKNITEDGLIEVGQIPCATHADCNILEECQPNYICTCLEGSCFR